MKPKTIAIEDLIRYLYGETDHAENQLFREILQNNWAVREKFLVLKECFSELNKQSFKPSQKVIDKLLNYANKQVLLAN